MANLALTLRHLQVPCAGAACDLGQLSSGAARTLRGALGLSIDMYAACSVVLALLPALVWFVVAGVISWRKPGEWLALLVALQLVVMGAGHEESIARASDPLWHGAAWAVLALYKTLLFLSLALFPDGRFVPRWMAWVVGAASILVVFPMGDFLFPTLLIPLTIAQVYRYWRVSGAVQRQQTKWVVVSSTIVFLWQLAVNTAPPLASRLGQPGSLGQAAIHALTPFVFVLIPLSIGMAILRYRLYDIDALIHRGLVYGVLTTCVVGIYVGSVGYLGALFRTGSNPAISLVGTGLVAVLFQPLRSRLQRGVSRLLYGERDDPYAVLARLGQRLEGTLAPETVLPAIVETVAETLKLPYVAITLASQLPGQWATGGGQQRGSTGVMEDTAAAYGTPIAHPLRLPLVYQGDQVGALLLAPGLAKRWTRAICACWPILRAKRG